MTVIYFGIFLVVKYLVISYILLRWYLEEYIMDYDNPTKFEHYLFFFWLLFGVGNKFHKHD